MWPPPRALVDTPRASGRESSIVTYRNPIRSALNGSSQPPSLLAHLHPGLAPLELDRPRRLAAGDVRLAVGLAEREDDPPVARLQQHRGRRVPGEPRGDDKDPAGDLAPAVRPRDQGAGDDARARGERREHRCDAEIPFGERGEDAGERDHSEREEPEPERRKWYAGVGAGSAFVAISRLRMPHAIQKAPHIPCIAVARTSRARNDHMPAMNCARPPNVAANGARYGVDVSLPHQPARCDATIRVAPAQPNGPSTDGAAIGCRTTRGRANPPYHPSGS